MLKWRGRPGWGDSPWGSGCQGSMSAVLTDHSFVLAMSVWTYKALTWQDVGCQRVDRCGASAHTWEISSNFENEPKNVMSKYSSVRERCASLQYYLCVIMLLICFSLSRALFAPENIWDCNIFTLPQQSVFVSIFGWLRVTPLLIEEQIFVVWNLVSSDIYKSRRLHNLFSEREATRWPDNRCCWDGDYLKLL